MSYIRGVLLAGNIRTHHELNSMSLEDQRNTLIVELSDHSNQNDYQRYDKATLAGMGAVLVFLRKAGIRDDAALRSMSADDQRNTLIVAIDAQTHRGQRVLQGLSNMELVLLGLGQHESYVGGILLIGGFRSHHELIGMSLEDQRNTLIVELTNRSNQNDYQRYDNTTLAGMGAILLLMREGRIRADQTDQDNDVG